MTNKINKNKEFILNLKKLIYLGRLVNFKKDELINKLKEVKLKEDMTFFDFFEHGFNIGNCGYTSMLLSLVLDDCFIVSGFNQFLKGTPNSPEGEHTWIEYKGKIYDPTLELISLPNDLGYEEIARISKQELLLFPNYFILNSYVKAQKPILEYKKIIENVMDYIAETNAKKMYCQYFEDEIVR